MSLHLEIVTPKGSVVDVEVSEVALPGKLGEFGVLDGHIPFLSALKPGVVRYLEGGEWKQLAIGSGYAEVGASRKVLVLTQSHARPGEIDLGETEKELADLEAQLKAWSGELTVEHQELLDGAAWAQARIDARKASSHN